MKKTNGRLNRKEALKLYRSEDLLTLGAAADRMRKKIHPHGVVSFIIDRNINYTNICINKCRFCAFYRDEHDPEAYVLSRRKLFKKIRETVALGGTQILIQGGLHPGLDIHYYIDLLRAVKEKFAIHIHGFSPPEICYIADKEGISVSRTLRALHEAGLDSIPGGGAEILSDRIRDQISPKKIGKERWLDVMERAHRIGMRTTATMMFGSIEEPEDIIEHLDAVRRLQDRTGGFTAFIPWSFQPGNTELGNGPKVKKRKETKKDGGSDHELLPATAADYLRVLALSRIYLDNVPNLQASWVTQGLKMAQVALRFGANDFGSTMIEENVVAAAGVRYHVSVNDIISAIRSAGFNPAQRDMYYKIIRERF